MSAVKSERSGRVKRGPRTVNPGTGIERPRFSEYRRRVCRSCAVSHRLPPPRFSPVPAELSRVRLCDQRRQRHRDRARRGQRPRGPRACRGPQSCRRGRQPHAQRSLRGQLGRGGRERLDLGDRCRAQHRSGHHSSCTASRCRSISTRTGNLAYVANSGSNSVSVVDLKARREIAQIGAGEEPVAARLAADGKTLVVANRARQLRDADRSSEPPGARGVRGLPRRGRPRDSCPILPRYLCRAPPATR